MTLSAKERAIRFIQGKDVDRIPFHPLVMQYAATLTGVPFSQYCLDYKMQGKAMMEFGRTYGMGSVHPSGFAYCEAGAYGLEVAYPEDDCPHHIGNLINDIEKDLHLIRPLDIENNEAMMNRVQGIKNYVECAGDEFFICGHCEGPLAEYTDLRGMTEGFMDLMDYPDEVKGAMSIIVQNAKRWMKMQIEAGAVCMSIGDAASSQIGEDLYIDFIKPFHKELVEYAHSLGAYSKLHICGNISAILPHLIEIGTNIIDVDCLVSDMSPFIDMLGENQVLCGNVDPVAVIERGTAEDIENAVKEVIRQGKNRCIISAGCEIPKITPIENYKAFYEAAKKYGSY